ncbi:hypothetical protein MTO96_013238 [Rhipicephalus appendiculatus]
MRLREAHKTSRSQEPRNGGRGPTRETSANGRDDGRDIARARDSRDAREARGSVRRGAETWFWVGAFLAHFPSARSARGAAFSAPSRSLSGEAIERAAPISAANAPPHEAASERSWGGGGAALNPSSPGFSDASGVHLETRAILVW